MIAPNLQTIPTFSAGAVTQSFSTGLAYRGGNPGPFATAILTIALVPTIVPQQGGVWRKPHPQPDPGVTARAVVSASLPALTGAVHGTSIERAIITAVLPALTAAGMARVPEAGAGAAHLPALIATGAAIAPIHGRGAASFPALQATIGMKVGSGGRKLRSWQACPRPASGFALSGRRGSLRDGEEQS